ncbi:hypothetical protein [Clostridium botulinum]|nr:hypothetical protein [Clostridium botulinum]MCD3204025.1 hypothetical protein [Clostridium botulinum C/D]MCD3222277.1 hypothetical protein [Clostridium botulinum C/D]MCD3232072.1 hypothetical protein [Clostridium botulinum C/D]MCD3273050.1 hypothetical protein [Clostridium botulinum C/D]MCD3296979.1 hypothetical protein [Clostridium botulinum C/D]
MKIEDIEVEVIMGENTSTIVTEAILKLYDNNASKILDISDLISQDEKAE